MKISECVCMTCGVDSLGSPLYRVSPYGEDNPKWKCEQCLGTPIDSELKRLVDTIHQSPL